MSDEELFNENESKFMHQVENFYTALSFAKVCAQKCNILKAERRSTLNENEVTCLSKFGFYLTFLTP